MVIEAEIMRAEPGALATREVALFDMPGCHFTETSLEIEDFVEYDQWLDIGSLLSRTSRAVQWWIGDWLAYGEHKWREKYAQGEARTGIEQRTLQQYNFVSEKVTPTRRRVGLSWSHHYEVAGLVPAEQERMLDKAEKEKWSKLRLRHEINQEKIERQDYPNEEPEVRRDYARIKAQFAEARKNMDAFVLEFTQFAVYWESLVGDVLWDLANPHQSSEDWVFRKVEGGCSKAREIMDETKLGQDIVLGALYRLEQQGKIFKTKQGAATDEQRGAREDIYMPVKQSNDDLYEGRRSSSNGPGWGEEDDDE